MHLVQQYVRATSSTTFTAKQVAKHSGDYKNKKVINRALHTLLGKAETVVTLDRSVLPPQWHILKLEDFLEISQSTSPVSKTPPEVPVSTTGSLIQTNSPARRDLLNFSQECVQYVSQDRKRQFLLVDLDNVHSCHAHVEQLQQIFQVQFYVGRNYPVEKLPPTCHVWQSTTRQKNAADARICWDVSRLCQSSIDLRLKILIMTGDHGWDVLETFAREESHSVVFLEHWKQLVRVCPELRQDP